MISDLDDRLEECDRADRNWGRLTLPITVGAAGAMYAVFALLSPTGLGPWILSNVLFVLLVLYGGHFMRERKQQPLEERRAELAAITATRTPAGQLPARALVFAYGSNLDSARMTGRVESASPVGSAELTGYELRFHKRGSDDGTGKADAYRTGLASDVVYGFLYELDAEGLRILDEHEGEGRGYDRCLLSCDVVVDGRPTKCEAWVYIADSVAIDDTLRPTRWYLDHVIRGAREHELPQELIESLQQTDTIE